MTETEKLLRELVALPSVNPAFLPAGHPHGSEQRVAEFLAARARKARLDVEWGDVLPGRRNLLVRLAPRARLRQRVLLAPHLDTVNGSDEQFTPRKRHGRLFGRGACDTKGSVAAMFSAICRLAHSPDRPTETELVFAGIVDEENAQCGSRALAASGLKASLAIVGEPTRLKVVTAHKGSVWVRVQTSGIAAHGARPELGRNAVHTAAEVVLLVQERYAAMLRKRHHPLLGCPTVSVGVIAGGTQPNIVPDQCFVEMDRRTLPGETETGVRRELAALMRSVGIEAACVSSKLAPCYPLETDPHLPLVAQFLATCEQRKPVGVDYFCDAAVLAQGGIPSVVFGPGDIAQAHTSDEWIELAAVETAARMLVRYLQVLP